jgi:ribosome recycling factor
MVKQLGTKVEDCRIALRAIRQDAYKDAKAKKDSKELSEDDVKRIEKEIDHSVSDFQKEIESLTKTTIFF